MRSRHIKWRIEANISLLRGSAILIEFFLFSSPMIFSVAFTQKVRALITCLVVNIVNE
jgi:hypothetical protein